MQESRSKRMFGQFGLVVATALVTVTLAGSGVASAFNVPMNSVNSGKIINNTVRSIDIRDGVVSSIDVRDNALTGTDLANGSVSSADVADGSIAAADLAPTAVTRWAHVGADDTPNLIAGRGATSVSRPALGNFTVNFTQPITNCALTATLSDNGAGASAHGEISVEQDNEFNPNAVRVRIYDSAGTVTDAGTTDGFMLSVSC